MGAPHGATRRGCARGRARRDRLARVPSRLLLSPSVYFVVLALALASGSCAAPGDDGGAPDLRMRVRWGLTEPADLPADVDRIEITVLIEGEEPDPLYRTRAGLEDMDGNGRPDILYPVEPGVPVEFRIVGEVSGTPVWVGHAGPMTLRSGERRYVDPMMFRYGDATPLPAGSMRGRFLHSASPLPDGRVLIAGGFDSATPATCPADQPAMSRCFALVATDEAYVYDPTRARFFPIEGDLIEARGGHTATALSDGRVLLAGGASDALLVMVPQGDPSAPSGFALSLLPRTVDGEETALATFEIFDPEANREVEDVDSDGDPGRGGFVGAADRPTQPGRLDRARFLATATAIPGTPRVLIAGGLGDAAASTTYAVFDADRAGGYGVLDTTAQTLAAPRVLAGAAAVGSGSAASVWVVGGTPAETDAALAEVWAPGGAADPVGSSQSASEAPYMFPSQVSGTPASHPEWSLVAPIVEPVGMGGSHLLVVGWYGPWCMPGTDTPTFAAPATSLERCGYTRSNLRSFTIDVDTGLAVATMTNNPHAFGASARLADGRILVSGGISSLQWMATNTVDVFTGAVSGGVANLSPTPLVLAVGRALHTATPLRDGGVLTFGGVSFGVGVSTLTLPAPEVIYLR